MRERNGSIVSSKCSWLKDLVVCLSKWLKNFHQSVRRNAKINHMIDITQVLGWVNVIRNEGIVFIAEELLVRDLVFASGSLWECHVCS